MEHVDFAAGTVARNPKASMIPDTNVDYAHQPFTQICALRLNPKSEYSFHNAPACVSHEGESYATHSHTDPSWYAYKRPGYVC